MLNMDTVYVGLTPEDQSNPHVVLHPPWASHWTPPSSLGYLWPYCKGRSMTTNRYWCKTTIKRHKTTIKTYKTTTNWCKMTKNTHKTTTTCYIICGHLCLFPSRCLAPMWDGWRAVSAQGSVSRNPSMDSWEDFDSLSGTSKPSHIYLWLCSQLVYYKSSVNSGRETSIDIHRYTDRYRHEMLKSRQE